MRKLILKSYLSPGDIVMLTAAVRDLHGCYPNQFQTDVRTLCPELWEHNPHLTPLSETDDGVEFVECSYPLIDRCNEVPAHSLHGYIDFLNQRLGLSIQPTLFAGDVHLSAQEKAWYSQVHELTGEDTPFWIVVAGGKHDVTIKWWSTDRFQEVVNHFRGRIQFVQVGNYGHHHPPLEGVINLRGKTNLRQLVRLVYHAQGVLCPVTAAMHLAAAIEVRPERTTARACVVVAGGREPAHWEAYPGHQFIHTNGALSCSPFGGCWKDRAIPLGDGDKRDRKANRCTDLVGALPRCMDLITSEEVIRRIEFYYQGGALSYLTPAQARAAEKGAKRSHDRAFDRQPLTLAEAGLACARAVQQIPEFPGGFSGRGLVICAGGVDYLPGAWVCIRLLRKLGCALPIELWHLGPAELDRTFHRLVTQHGVTCVDALHVRRRNPARMLAGWPLKAYAMVHSPFREVLLLDADNVPVLNPEFLFESGPYVRTGAVFWPDYGRSAKTAIIWRSCGLRRPPGPEFESGQMLVDKQRCWKALQLALWFNEHADFYYQYLHGDKETFHLAFRKVGKTFAMPCKPIEPLPGTMCQHDFRGRRVFQHRNGDKWNLFLHNRHIPDFRHERLCRVFLRELQSKWDGGARQALRRYRPNRARSHVHLQETLALQVCMISCSARARLREQTLRNLAGTDWADRPVLVQLDEGRFANARERQAHTAYLALGRCAGSQADFLLFLEDDLQFNRFLWTNLRRWQPLLERRVTLASLYNPGLRTVACDVKKNARIVAPDVVFGSQALLLSRATIRHVLQHWETVGGMQDIRISRLAGQLQNPIYYHAPSLVQHVGRDSLWGGYFHQAIDFAPNWKAPGL